MNELTLYSYDAVPMAVERKPRTGDYTISVFGGPPSTLRRGVDFGMIRRKDGSAQTKHPTLFKSGAEKVAVAYGLCQRYHLESKVEDHSEGFFFYCVRCDLVKIVDGQEYPPYYPPVPPPSPERMVVIWRRRRLLSEGYR